MTEENKLHIAQWIQTIGSIASVLVAAVAIYIAIQAQEDNKKWAAQQQAINAKQLEQTQLQIHDAKEVSKANIKPLLYIKSIGFSGHGGFALENNGLGTAIIKKATFSKNGICSKSLASLFKFNEVSSVWKEGFNLHEEHIYLKPGDKLNLVIISTELLHSKSIPYPNRILQSFYDQWHGLTAVIEYEDVFGNKMQTLRQSWNNNSNKELQPTSCVGG